MQVAIDPADRKLLLGGGAVLLLLLGAIAFFTPPAAQSGAPVASTFSPQPTGALAAYLLLQDLHFNVRRWEAPPNELPAGVSDAVLILANPSESPEKREREALDRFVRSGGRVLITGEAVQDFFDGADLLPSTSNQGDASYGARASQPFTREATTVVLQPEGLWQQLGPAQTALYGDAQHPAVVSWQIGAGQVLWWAGPTPLTNAGITREGNLNLFLNAVGVPLDGEQGRPTIYWDEYYHGERTSLWAYTRNTPLPWALVQFLIITAAIFFTFSRRAGPQVTPFAEPRLWPLEFVDTLGALYERAGAVSAAVGIVYRHFRSALVHRLRIPMATSEAALIQNLDARLGRSGSTLTGVLHAAEDAGETDKLTPAEGLAMIQQLESLEEKLGLKKPSVEGRP